MTDRWKLSMDTLAESIVASQTSKVLKPEKYAAVIQHLKDPSAKVDAHLKRWVKQIKFQLMDLPALGVSNGLVASIQNPENARGPSRDCPKS